MSQNIYVHHLILFQWSSLFYSYFACKKLEDHPDHETRREVEYTGGMFYYHIFLSVWKHVFFFQTSYFRLKLIHNKRKQYFSDFLECFCPADIVNSKLSSCHILDTTNSKELESALEHVGCITCKESFWLSLGPAFFIIPYFIFFP